MARKQTLDAILSLFQKLGGNTSEVLGTKTNVNFLGKGKSPELMLDMDINADALAVLPRSKAVEELTNSVGYAVSGKLNDIQANQLLKNMQTMDSVYFPPAAPKNVTDFATGTPDLDKAGLMSLRQGRGDLVRGGDDLPPPGSRGGADDIAAPIGSAEETIRNLAKSEGVDAAETILPTGAGLESLKQIRNASHMSLKDELIMEYRMVQRCVEIGDFFEGVRAMLVDKDRKPNWKPKKIQDVDETRVNLFFEDLGDLDLILTN